MWNKLIIIITAKDIQIQIVEFYLCTNRSLKYYQIQTDGILYFPAKKQVTSNKTYTFMKF